MNFLRSARRGEAGQAAVEFALTIVFLMLLIVGFVELIMMLHTYNVIADSAKEGVRYAIVHGAANTGVGVTVSYVYQPFFGLGWPTVTVNAAAKGRIIF